MPEEMRLKSLADYADSRHKLLVTVQATPSAWVTVERFTSSLRSQGLFAALDLPESNVTPCSLNTLKKSATLSLNGGFSELDDLRRFVSEQIERTRSALSTGKPATKAFYKNRSHDLEAENSQLKEDLWHVTRAFYRAMTNARSYAAESGNSALVARCADDEIELRAMVSLARNKSSISTDGANREP